MRLSFSSASIGSNTETNYIETSTFFQCVRRRTQWVENRVAHFVETVERRPVDAFRIAVENLCRPAFQQPTEPNSTWRWRSSGPLGLGWSLVSFGRANVSDAAVFEIRLRLPRVQAGLKICAGCEVPLQCKASLRDAQNTAQRESRKILLIKD